MIHFRAARLWGQGVDVMMPTLFLLMLSIPLPSPPFLLLVPGSGPDRSHLL